MQIVYLLFEDIKYRQEDNKFKPLHEIQKLVAEQFKEITGLTAPHSDFLSVSRTFVNIRVHWNIIKTIGSKRPFNH